MRILIIEDEPRASRQLESKLKECNFDYQLLGILDSIEEVLIWFSKYKAPDLIFMDIQLADGLSFEIFQKIEIEAPIIFTTAFDQYAIQAFKVNSIDYLLKPIQKEDLKMALDQFKKANAPITFDQNMLSQLMNNIRNPKNRSGILVKDGSGMIQIKVIEILYFYSEDSITFAVLGAKRYIVDETMDQLLQTLDPNHFFRINRGQIVGKSAIQKIEPYFNHRVKISVTSPRDQEFIVSRQKTGDFKSWLNN